MTRQKVRTVTSGGFTSGLRPTVIAHTQAGARQAEAESRVRRRGQGWVAHGTSVRDPTQSEDCDGSDMG